MMNKTKVFYNYLSGENFAFSLNSYIQVLTSYHLKTFFCYMMNKMEVFQN